MLDQVRSYIHQHTMLAEGDIVIVSVSGGADSVALLHLLRQVAEEFALTLHVFHMDHGLRGETSAEDALFVRRLADEWGLPSTVVGLGPEVLKRQTGSLQANARAVRYAEIESLARRIGANRVAVGHNRDDQAETVLMRLLRGAGSHGLGGIHPARSQGDLTFIRPLLATSRLEIEAHCRENGLSYRTDESNARPAYHRNSVRLELLPLLAERYNPSIKSNLAQLADLLREEDDLLEALALEALARCRGTGDKPSLVGQALLQEPPALARRVIRLAARQSAGAEIDLGHAAVEMVLQAASREAGSSLVDLPQGIRVVSEYGLLRFLTSAEGRSLPLAAEWPVSLSGITEIPELTLRIEAWRGGDSAEAGLLVLDADHLPGPLAIRFRRPGDRIWPMGMEGSKKLQDILVDAKVPHRLRDRVPVLVSGPEILAVLGHRIDRRFLAGESTQNRLFVRVSTWEAVP